jgi:hypothetical protein
MNIKHFIELSNKIKYHIQSKPTNKQKKLTLVNCDGVKLMFMPKSFSKHTVKKKVDMECVIYCENDNGRIISPRGAPLIFQELEKNNKLDIVKWHFEEFIIGRI